MKRTLEIREQEMAYADGQILDPVEIKENVEKIITNSPIAQNIQLAWEKNEKAVVGL